MSSSKNERGNWEDAWKGDFSAEVIGIIGNITKEISQKVKISAYGE